MRPALLRFFLTPVGDGIAPLVEFDVVDQGLDGFAGEAAFPDALGEGVAEFFAPAEPGDEAVPDVAFFGGWFARLPWACARVNTGSSVSSVRVRLLISTYGTPRK